MPTLILHKTPPGWGDFPGKSTTFKFFTTMAKSAITTNMVTGKVRFSYVHVFEPSAIEPGAVPKYNVQLLISKDDKATLSKIKQIVDALKAEFAANNLGKIPTNFKTPLRDGDTDPTKGGDEAYEGVYFMSASSKSKPGVVKAGKTKGTFIEITDEDEFYSGCYGLADINFYTFDKAGNKGIACGLNNVLKLEDGDSLAGRRSAAAAFGDVEIHQGEEEEENYM